MKMLFFVVSKRSMFEVVSTLMNGVGNDISILVYVELLPKNSLVFPEYVSIIPEYKSGDKNFTIQDFHQVDKTSLILIHRCTHAQV